MAVLSEGDEGKFLVDAEGEQLGIVTEVDVDENVAYVEPDPGMLEAWVQSLGYGDADEDDMEVPGEAIETVGADEIRVDEEI